MINSEIGFVFILKDFKSVAKIKNILFSFVYSTCEVKFSAYLMNINYK